MNAMHAVPDDMGRRLEYFGQQHLLAGWDHLDAHARRQLIAQLAPLDFEELQRLHAGRQQKHALPDFARLTSLPQPAESDIQLTQCRQLGAQAFRNGEIAFLLVAGGQGTRLGFDDPKGMFPIGPVTGATLFQLHAEKILAIQRRFGKPMPLLVMTSPATHDPTVAFFTEQKHFGLPGEHVHFFCQGIMPALDYESGKLLLEAPGRLSLSPNGHGGVLAALADSGLFDRLQQAGVTTISYFQVDNPLTTLADFEFVGRHRLQRAHVSTKVLPKRHALEKMGNLVIMDGRCSIIEYSDLPGDWATRQNSQGGLFFWGGNTGTHLFDVDFLRRVCVHQDSIPWHLAKKKVPFLGPDGQTIQPEKENALKFERFIFDVLPLAERWTVPATTRARDFEPLKNATGDDSIETVRQALIQRAASWLEQAGVDVPRDDRGLPVFPVEISPLLALDAEELKRMTRPGLRVGRPLHLGPDFRWT
jgi:UDP-N-acetylglucosamine/UDP-N-acetylgalactosamine diphosphorylase